MKEVIDLLAGDLSNFSETITACGHSMRIFATQMAATYKIAESVIGAHKLAEKEKISVTTCSADLVSHASSQSRMAPSVSQSSSMKAPAIVGSDINEDNSGDDSCAKSRSKSSKSMSSPAPVVKAKEKLPRPEQIRVAAPIIESSDSSKSSNPRNRVPSSIQTTDTYKQCRRPTISKDSHRSLLGPQLDVTPTPEEFGSMKAWLAGITTLQGLHRRKDDEKWIDATNILKDSIRNY